MKLSCLVLFLIVLTSVAFSEENESKYYAPIHIAKAIEQKLPKGWKCKYDYSVIVFSYESKVDLLSIIDLSEPPSVEAAKRKGDKSDYIIIFYFTHKYTDEEYNDLLSIRKKFAGRIKGLSRREVDNYTEEKFPLPKYYNKVFSVFLQKTTDDVIRAYPEEIQHQANDIINEFEKYFKKYPDVPNDVKTTAPSAPADKSDQKK